MRRGVFIFFLGFMFSPYFLGAQNAAFNTGKWAKIAIAKQGIYQITGAQLRTLGFPLPIASSQLQFFNYNLSQLTEKVTPTVSTALTENAIQVMDGGDNQIDEKDYDIFIDCFVGGGSVFLGRNFNPKIKEIINDLDEKVYYAFKGLKDDNDNIQNNINRNVNSINAVIYAD